MQLVIRCIFVCFALSVLSGGWQTAAATPVTMYLEANVDQITYDYMANASELVSVDDTLVFGTFWDSDYTFPAGGWDDNYAGMTTDLHIPGYGDPFHVASYSTSNSGELENIHYLDIVSDAYFFLDLVNGTFSLGFCPVTGYYFNATGHVTAVPEPDAMLLFGVGIMAAIGWKRYFWQPLSTPCQCS